MSEKLEYNAVSALDDLYSAAIENITAFFRYHKNNPGADFGEEYYQRVGRVFKSRIDLELKYINEPYLK